MTSKALTLAIFAAVFSASAVAQNPYSGLPVAFSENHGQADPRVRFFAQGPHYGFFLTAERISVSLQPSGGQAVALDLQFVHSSQNVLMSGNDRAPGSVNYLLGPDPAGWQTGVARYNEVLYRDLWPGIDLSVREQRGTLKYEFHVHPGARPAAIRLAARGANSLELDSTGAMLIHTASGIIRDTAPISFQQIGDNRIPVESRYALANTIWGFEIGGNYDPAQELIIDPGIEYSTFLGGASDDVPRAIAVDAAGNTYIVGWTQSPDFPATPGAFDRTGAASNNLDVFVAKLNPTGTALVYATFIGGSNFDWGRAIAVDAAGNAYIAGQTKSSDFPVTGNAFQKTLAHLNCPRCGIDNYDAFVAKLNPSGTGLVYATYLGGASSIDDALAIAIDSAGNAFVAGETSSPDFPTTAGAFRRTDSGGDDTFVAKVNPTGSALVYSTYVGGTQEEFPTKIAVDLSGNAIVYGNTSSADFPTTPGVFDTTQNGAFDGFLFKLNPAGAALVYSTLFGGSGFDSSGGMALDSGGNIYLSGTTASPDFPTTAGSLQPVCTGSDGFLTKFNPTATTLIYSTCLSGAFTSAVALTPAGNLWFTGSSTGGFTTTPDAGQRFPAAGPSGPVANAIIGELNAAGSALLYATYFGGTGGDGGADIALDPSGNVYIAGHTLSPDFPTTSNALDRTFAGRSDIFWGDGFITKLALNGSAPPPPAPPVLASFSSSAIQVVGGNSFSLTATLSTGAQTGGASVSITAGNPAVSVPATVNIAAGAQSQSIAATTSAVAANTPVTVTASFGGVSKSVVVTLLPVPPAGQLSSLGMFPNTITGGSTALGIIGLTNPAPAGGYTVTLSTNNAIATVPATFTVPAGETTGSFTVTTAPVTQSTGLTVFARAGTLTALAPLTVTPATPPVTSVGLTVNATGRSGERITSSPSGISVTSGSNQQATFNIGTAITLSVSNGRDAIWSGACSSGGSKTKTCTFTLNAAAAVTANIQ